MTEKKVALVTGSAGFIGFHVAKKLLENGWTVIGVDCLSDYYDVALKRRRESILLQNQNYSSNHEYIEKPQFLLELFKATKPDVVIHLAAQAGVRHSVSDPRSYLESNIIGTFELLEAAKVFPPKHMLMASTSSAYGANIEVPYKETHQADHQLSFYAATKKATENIAHSYAYLHGLPITMFRFFTVYGPWGRPDMALFKFTKAMLEGVPIDVYNHGEMSRDFTFIDDLVHAIILLIAAIPSTENSIGISDNGDKLFKPVAPFQLLNIGNSNPIKLRDFIAALERKLGVTAIKNLLPMQSGDVQHTWADTSRLNALIGYTPATDLDFGVAKFVDWYRKHYEV